MADSLLAAPDLLAALNLQEATELSLPIAWDVSFSPLPIVFFIALLLTEKPIKLALTYTVVWFVSFFVSLAISYYIYEGLASALSPTVRTSAAWVWVGIGVILVVLSIGILIRQRGKDHTQQQDQARALIDRASTLSLTSAAAIAAIFCALNFSNWPFFLAIANVLNQAEPSTAQLYPTLAVISVVGTIAQMLILAAFLLGGKYAIRLGTWIRDQLIKHAGPALPTLFLIIGVMLIIENSLKVF